MAEAIIFQALLLIRVQIILRLRMNAPNWSSADTAEIITMHIRQGPPKRGSDADPENALTWVEI
jgi:hypothetical protein